MHEREGASPAQESVFMIHMQMRLSKYFSESINERNINMTQPQFPFRLKHIIQSENSQLDFVGPHKK